jgi:hypothetical protein
MTPLRRPCRGTTAVRLASRRIEEIRRCPFTNDFVTSSALSAADPRATTLPACRARMLGAVAAPTPRRRAGWMNSRLPKDKSSSGLVATATVTGLENWRAVRNRSRALAASASCHPPDVSSGPWPSIASPRTWRSVSLAATELAWKITVDLLVNGDLVPAVVFAGAVIAAGQREGQMYALVASPESASVGVHIVALEERHLNAIRQLSIRDDSAVSESAE